MQIKTVQMIIDDDGTEVRRGDTVLIQTKDMEDTLQAVVHDIMTNMAVFIIDDRGVGYKPVKVRANDVDYLKLYKRKKISNNNT